MKSLRNDFSLCARACLYTPGSVLVCILLPGDRVEIVPSVKRIRADSSITKFSWPLVSSNLPPLIPLASFSLFSLCWYSVRISQCFDSGSCTSGFTGPDKFSVCICSSVKLRVRFISLGFSLSLSVCRRAHLRATRGKCVLLRCYCVCIGADELSVFPIKVSSPFHHLWASEGFCEPIWPLLYSKQTLFGNIWELLQGRCLTYLNISNYSHDLYTK